MMIMPCLKKKLTAMLQVPITMTFLKVLVLPRMNWMFHHVISSKKNFPLHGHEIMINVTPTTFFALPFWRRIDFCFVECSRKTWSLSLNDSEYQQQRLWSRCFLHFSAFESCIVLWDTPGRQILLFKYQQTDRKNNATSFFLLSFSCAERFTHFVTLSNVGTTINCVKLGRMGAVVERDWVTL